MLSSAFLGAVKNRPFTGTAAGWLRVPSGLWRWPPPATRSLLSRSPCTVVDAEKLPRRRPFCVPDLPVADAGRSVLSRLLPPLLPASQRGNEGTELTSRPARGDGWVSWRAREVSGPAGGAAEWRLAGADAATLSQRGAFIFLRPVEAEVLLRSPGTRDTALSDAEASLGGAPGGGLGAGRLRAGGGGGGGG